MNAYPKISIVTPTFNQGQYIEQTIQSVLDQQYPNLEYMIIDGGSTDNTVDLIRKYEKHLTWWVSEKDNGQSHAINKGISRCTGSIFNWINSDDYYEGKVFEKVAHAFSTPGVHMFAGCSRVFGGEKEWISKGTKLPLTGNKEGIHPSIDQPATFFSMDAVKTFGPLNEKMHYTMDLEWLMKFWFMYGINAIARTNDVLVHFREHPGSKTVNFQQRFTDDRIKLYQSILSQFVKEIAPLEDYRFDLQNNSGVSLETLARTTNRYIYFELQEAYAKRDFSRFKKLYGLLVPQYLREEESAMLKKQKQRSQLLRFFKLSKS